MRHWNAGRLAIIITCTVAESCLHMSPHYRAAPASISLPFLLVQTKPHATVELEIAEDQQLVHFDFNSMPFEIQDEHFVLKCAQPPAPFSVLLTYKILLIRLLFELCLALRVQGDGLAKL